MFTGIVTDKGQIAKVTPGGDTRVRIHTGYDANGIDLGASIACDGCCLTVVAKGLKKTNLGNWTKGQEVNLERALRLGDELGGHLVSGHVDGVAEVTVIQDEGDSTRMTFEAPGDLAKFIAPKGSVVLNGTSLTVNEVDGNSFGINLIPHTKAVTTWGQTKMGDQINLEIDTLARYVARLAEYGRLNELG